MLLTNAQGKTLYYFKADTPTTAACTGGCASTWPPYLATGTPGSATTLTGKLAVQTTANGQQVTYNGHMLYTYSGDTAPGQTNGEGIGNKWFVATNDLAASGGQQNTSPGSNKYGY
jgi:predicted lipoprotein with Yx(FWY)xxD motif